LINNSSLIIPKLILSLYYPDKALNKAGYPFLFENKTILFFLISELTKSA